MQIITTYKGTLDGVYGVYCGYKPDGLIVEEETIFYRADEGKVFVRKKDGIKQKDVILEDGETIDDYDEVIGDKEEVFDDLKLTRGDVFRGIFQAKGIKREQIRALIEAMAETTEEEKIAKELASIDFDEALYFYRQNPLIDKIGNQLGISTIQMTKFFETGDWHELIKE